MYRARLTRSILRKTECEIVAVKTIKGKDTIWCHLHVHNSKLLINDIVMRIVMCQFCHSKFSYTTETLVHSVHMILIPSLLVNQSMTHTETHASNIYDNCLNIWYMVML